VYVTGQAPVQRGPVITIPGGTPVATRTEYYIEWNQEDWFPRFQKVQHNGELKMEVLIETYGSRDEPDQVRSITAMRVPVRRYQNALATPETLLKAVVARMRKRGHKVNLIKETGGHWGSRSWSVKVPRDADLKFRVPAAVSK
jgi:hypothetical protein